MRVQSTGEDVQRQPLAILVLSLISHLAFIVLVRELDVDLVLCAYLGDHCSLPPYDFRVILWIYSDCQFEASQGLKQEKGSENREHTMAVPVMST